jgi:glycosyltransferase involved in cell wall biosynthesis
MERWASSFENAVFDIADNVFVASYFALSELLMRRPIQHNKVKVTGFNLDFAELNKYKDQYEKQNIIVFNGRNCEEKQPWKFEELKSLACLNGWTFINTHAENYTKHEYYKILAQSKIVISFALQENFGFGINEAVYLGCTPIVPDRLVYTETYQQMFRYGNDIEMRDLLEVFSKDEARELWSDSLPKFKYSDYCYREWFRL